MLKNTRHTPSRTELRDLVHELAGAFLFGMPFLYTMEIWCAEIQPDRLECFVRWR
jgi:uncharacterized membrane protein